MFKRALNWEPENPSSSLTLPLTHQVTSAELFSFADADSSSVNWANNSCQFHRIMRVKWKRDCCLSRWGLYQDIRKQGRHNHSSVKFHFLRIARTPCNSRESADFLFCRCHCTLLENSACFLISSYPQHLAQCLAPGRIELNVFGWSEDGQKNGWRNRPW